jgi:hypothetical protein
VSEAKKSNPPPPMPASSTDIVVQESTPVTILPPDGNGGKTPPPVLNVNLVINQLAEKERPELLPERLRETLAIIREHEAADLELRRQHVDITLYAKKNDPDRISKRADATSRRLLRYAVALGSLTTVGLVVFLVLHGAIGPLVASAIGLVTLSMALATGLAAGGDAPSLEEIGSFVGMVLRRDDSVDAGKAKPQAKNQPKPKRRGRK